MFSVCHVNEELKFTGNHLLLWSLRLNLGIAIDGVSLVTVQNFHPFSPPSPPL